MSITKEKKRKIKAHRYKLTRPKMVWTFLDGFWTVFGRERPKRSRENLPELICKTWMKKRITGAHRVAAIASYMAVNYIQTILQLSLDVICILT
jgi:hypothetical protein